MLSSCLVNYRRIDPFFDSATTGSTPRLLEVQQSTQHDIQQVILLQKDYPEVKVVILGGHEAPLVSSNPK